MFKNTVDVSTDVSLFSLQNYCYFKLLSKLKKKKKSNMKLFKYLTQFINLETKGYTDYLAILCKKMLS